MKAKETIQAIMAQGLAAALKREGFRKTQFSFARRSGAAAQFVQVQPPSWNQGVNGAFYANVGIMFDAVRRHFGLAAPPLPKYDDCDFLVRLAQAHFFEDRGVTFDGLLENYRFARLQQ